MTDSSPPSPAQRPDGQTVDEEAVRRRFDLYRDHQSHAFARQWSCCSAHGPADDVPALLADLDAAREALRRAEEQRDELAATLLIAGANFREVEAERDEALAAQVVVQCDDPEHAERDRMRPVVEAAKNWRRITEDGIKAACLNIAKRAEICQALDAAVDTYEDGTE